MTEGRFETIHNLRPKNWDNRRHWTNWHHLYDCEADHLARESCPFHDLRAGGQFQYENWGGGPYAVPIEPKCLNNRANGDRMDFALSGGTALAGWGNIPLETEAGRPTPEATTVPRHRAVFTKKNPLKRGLFSEYPYMPEGEPVDCDAKHYKAAESGKVQGGGSPSGMKAGGRHEYLGLPTEHIPDPYNDKIGCGRRNYFRTGPVPHDYPKWMPQGSADRKKKKKDVLPFYAGKHPNAGIILAGDMEWIPDPYSPCRIDGGRRPFRTWHTHTKWSMPTYAPWTTGLSTAEPRKGGALNLTEENLPSLATYDRVNLKQTIGSEAALSTMNSLKSTLPRIRDGKHSLVKQKMV
ncbi:unnamed protein product [Phytomonas sp. EM1]|nr:unnamed protein product [Phytomonas sp. EM1]|eukprot:CCW64261.1 unnamed protein product [Phytomonas sp. isolate EM1]